MHSKIIQPAKQGKVAYDNKGSCNALVEYLGHEARENKASLTFFNSYKDGFLAAEVKKAIDFNVKGLKKGEVKFYSLVISPSHEELKHLDENSKKSVPHSTDESLKLFTRQVMENYAANFNLNSSKNLSSSDLQWYATIHHQRQFKGNHKQVREGEAKRGETKSGLNAHIHIIVSKRDLKQQITLNPQSSKERFEIKGWQKENEQSFDKIFAYTRDAKQERGKDVQLTEEQKERFHHRISGKLSMINGLLDKSNQLSQYTVEQIAGKKGYSQTFFYNLNRLETNLRKGQTVREPLHLLEYNKDKKPERLNGCRLGEQVEKAFKVLASEKMAIDEELPMPNIQSSFKRRPYRPVTEQEVDRRTSGQSI
jgi:hypothetical protein